MNVALRARSCTIIIGLYKQKGLRTLFRGVAEEAHLANPPHEKLSSLSFCNFQKLINKRKCHN